MVESSEKPKRKGKPNPAFSPNEKQTIRFLVIVFVSGMVTILSLLVFNSAVHSTYSYRDFEVTSLAPLRNPMVEVLLTETAVVGATQAAGTAQAELSDDTRQR